jgi:DNA-binding transcriptional LysR family regulator
VKLLLQEDYSTAVRTSLLAGQIDIGIMSCEAQHPDLVLQPLFKESMWLIGRPRDWPFKKRRLNPSVLDELPLVVGSFMRVLRERQQGRYNFNLHVVARLTHSRSRGKRFVPVPDFSWYPFQPWNGNCAPANSSAPRWRASM